MLTTRVDYTTAARNLAFRHPLISSLMTQVLFWSIAYFLLGTIIFFTSEVFNSTYNFQIPNPFLPIFISSAAMGLFFGLIHGYTDFYFFRKWSKGKSLGRLILIKGLFYFIVTVIIFATVRFVLWSVILKPFYFSKTILAFGDNVWKSYFKLVAIYTFFMSVFISFIIQINKRFGPGVVLPLILGKYVYPNIEERAFIFLDLTSSTAHAEKLGHVKYSKLIRDCISDINQVCIPYQAEIYQYVGDEIVLSWLIDHDTDLLRSIDLYFACQAVFDKRKEYYLNKYEIFPQFKAGLHKGVVTRVEVGEIKRELAFHGDTLNVAARILARCNEFGADILISKAVYENLKSDNPYNYELIGTVDLKGRAKPVTIYKVTLP